MRRIRATDPRAGFDRRGARGGGFWRKLRTMSEISDLHIQAVDVSVVRLLRSRVLRPFQTPEELVYEHDAQSDAVHLAALEAGRLVGTSTVFRDEYADLARREGSGGWRIRGMAVVSAVQGRGIGRDLVEACLAVGRRDGGRYIWCNGRVTAARFYAHLGFEVLGEPFDMPGIGPHYVLWRRL